MAMSIVKKTLESTPFVGKPLIDFIWSIKKKIKKVDSSGIYWDELYKAGGNSGEGSYSILAEFKAEIINMFVKEQNIKSVIEFGCGDGNQLKLMKYPNYTGLDVSPTIISKNIEYFNGDYTKSFFVYNSNAFEDNERKFKADLALSLDVIYHILEDDIYEKYMNHLFNASDKFVIIYSSNIDSPPNHHERDHMFSKWVEKKRPDWKLLKFIPNKYPSDKNDPVNTSKADFYIYEKQQ